MQIKKIAKKAANIKSAQYATRVSARLFCICKARNGTRTRDFHLGKVALYQLSYSRAYCYDTDALRLCQTAPRAAQNWAPARFSRRPARILAQARMDCSAARRCGNARVLRQPVRLIFGRLIGCLLTGGAVQLYILSYESPRHAPNSLGSVCCRSLVCFI